MLFKKKKNILSDNSINRNLQTIYKSLRQQDGVNFKFRKHVYKNKEIEFHIHREVLFII